jgi:hypothetical protein
MRRGARIVRLLASALAACALLAVASPPSRAAAQEDAPVIRAGQTVRGTLTDDDVELFDDGPTNHWRFVGHRGQRLRIRMASPEFDPYVSLERTDAGHVTVVGYRSGPAGSAGATLDVTLPADGEYVIEATVLDADQRGAYTLSVQESGR